MRSEATDNVTANAFEMCFMQFKVGTTLDEWNDSATLRSEGTTSSHYIDVSWAVEVVACELRPTALRVAKVTTK